MSADMGMNWGRTQVGQNNEARSNYNKDGGGFKSERYFSWIKHQNQKDKRDERQGEFIDDEVDIEHRNVVQNDVINRISRHLGGISYGHLAYE